MTPTPSSQFNAALFNQAVFGGAQPPGLVVQAGEGLLYPALRKAAITIGPQRTPSPAQFQDAIEELNRLVGSFNCDRMFIFTEQILTFPLNAGQKIYTIGIDPSGAVTADFAVQRPQQISYANVILEDTAPPIRYPLAVLTTQAWSRIRLQDLPNTIPQAIYMDNNWPIANLYIYGQPTIARTLEMYVWANVQQFFGLADVVLLPPGYEDALVLNLACRLAPHFQRILDPDVRQQARESMMRLESLNAPRPILTIPWGCPRQGSNINNYNIYSDEFYR